MPEETTTTTSAAVAEPQTTTSSVVPDDDADWTMPGEAPPQAADAPEGTSQTPPAEDATAPAAGEQPDSEPSPQADDEFDASTLAYGKMFGWNEEEIRAFGTRANFEKALAQHESLLRARAMGQRSSVEPQPSASPTTDGQPEAPQLDLAKLAEQVDPETFAAIKALHEGTQRYVAKLTEVEKLAREQKSFIDQLQQAAVQQRVAAQQQWAKSVIGELPESYRALLKAGPAGDRALQNILDDANRLYDQLVRENPQIAQDETAQKALVQRAFKREFAEQILEIERAELAKKLAERRTQSTTPPTHRTKPKLTGDPRRDAELAVRAKAAELGLPLDETEPDDDW